MGPDAWYSNCIWRQKLLSETSMGRALAPKQGPINSEAFSRLHGSIPAPDRPITRTAPPVVQDCRACGGPRPYRQDFDGIQTCYSVLLPGRNSKLPSSQRLQQSSKDGSPIRLTTMASWIPAGGDREDSPPFSAGHS